MSHNIEGATDLVITHLGQYVTDHKKSFIESVLNQRTRHITLVLEDIFQSQNASAVFRTAECFGIQDIHIIENVNKYSFSKGVLKGANKWLNLIHHRKQEAISTPDCFEILRKNGYKILATSPTAELSIGQIDISNKIAIVIGNELHGLSDYALAHADINARIPMYGFTESLNLSASAAICINELVSKLKLSNIDWRIAEEERSQLRLSWYRKLVKNAELIEKRFLQSIK